MQNIPKKIIVHHSADVSADDQLMKINEYHKQREFPESELGYFVGYHYVINKAGRLTQTRNDWEEGAHCRGLNFSSIGICLEGNFDIELPTEEQENTLGELLLRLCGLHNLDVTDIYPHRAFSVTNCYGKKLHSAYAGLIYLEHLAREIESTKACTDLEN